MTLEFFDRRSELPLEVDRIMRASESNVFPAQFLEMEFPARPMEETFVEKPVKNLGDGPIQNSDV